MLNWLNRCLGGEVFAQLKVRLLALTGVKVNSDLLRHEEVVGDDLVPAVSSNLKVKPLNSFVFFREVLSRLHVMRLKNTETLEGAPKGGVFLDRLFVSLNGIAAFLKQLTHPPEHV